MESERVDFDLKTLVEDVSARMAPQAQTAGLRLDCLIRPDVPTGLQGDRDRLRQLLTSLAGIAMEATVHGEVGLRVRSAGGGSLRFEITGTPSGDGAGEWGPVLEALSGAGASTAAGPRGLELRLGTCRRLAAAIGAEVAVERGPGHGHTLWFAARFERAGTPRPAPAAPAAPPVEAGTGRVRVLVADDSLVNQEVAKRTLQKMGYDVDVAGDGLAAVEAVAGGSYAVVLMDCQMPGMDGYQATEAIRHREGAERHTPVVAMTASAMQADRQRCLDAGMDDYVSKPFEFEHLQAVVAHWAQAHADGVLTAGAPD